MGDETTMKLVHDTKDTRTDTPIEHACWATMRMFWRLGWDVYTTSREKDVPGVFIRRAASDWQRVWVRLVPFQFSTNPSSWPWEWVPVSTVDEYPVFHPLAVVTWSRNMSHYALLPVAATREHWSQRRLDLHGYGDEQGVEHYVAPARFAKLRRAHGGAS